MDKTTYLNLSNHSCFNLSGDFTGNALSQLLRISADRYISNDNEHLPTADVLLYDAPSGQTLELTTNAPCLVLYSGGYLAGGPNVLHRDNTEVLPLFPCCLLNSGETAN